MLRLPQIALSVLSLTLTPVASTHAQADSSPWKQVGGWDIDFNSNWEGCLASTTYEGGTWFAIGFQKEVDGLVLSVALLDKAWESIEAGKEYAVKVYFGDETPWDLNMIGRETSGTRGLQFYTDAYSEKAGIFVEEFQRELGMKWYYQNVMMGNFSLRDTRRAFNEVVACQKSFHEALAGVSDPFGRAPKRRSDDPFSQ